jgi:hypothetical protein
VLAGLLVLYMYHLVTCNNLAARSVSWVHIVHYIIKESYDSPSIHPSSSAVTTFEVSMSPEPVQSTRSTI